LKREEGRGRWHDRPKAGGKFPAARKFTSETRGNFRYQRKRKTCEGTQKRPTIREGPGKRNVVWAPWSQVKKPTGKGAVLWEKAKEGVGQKITCELKVIGRKLGESGGNVACKGKTRGKRGGGGVREYVQSGARTPTGLRRVVKRGCTH